MTATPYQDGYGQALRDAARLVSKIDPMCFQWAGDALSEAESGIDRLHSALPPEPSPWRPIEEAPRDGTLVDLWSEHGGRVLDAWFDEVECMWSTEGRSGPIAVWYRPTHFMLPPPGPEGD